MSITYYSSLSGMLAASYGLQNTSNNIANMQSPGFKRQDVFYSSLGTEGNKNQLGGVYIGGRSINFNDGHYLETNNPSNLAIIGQGFFVIRLKTGALLYTRAGDFDFNKEGILIDKHTEGQVLGYNKVKQLVAIHAQGPKTAQGKATREIFLKGSFILKEKSASDQNQPGPFKNKYQDISFSAMNIYDAQGLAHRIQCTFQSTPVLVPNGSTDIPDNGLSWDLVSISCDDAEISVPPNQRLCFSGVDQGATLENNAIHFSFKGGSAIKLHFGSFKEGSNSSVQLKESKLNPEGTHIETIQNDGYGAGKQISFSFDENGQIFYHYDHGQTISGVHLGLARFDDLQHTLVPAYGSLFKAQGDQGIHFGQANQNGFGSIQSKQIESSNVDSTTEFANIVLLQRMFQACSQIMNIEKQLFEGLESK